MLSLVVIPARGGSKGVPGKNIKMLNGKPLINYTIEAARSVFKDEYIYVSTDSNEIKEVAEQIGLLVPFIRPKRLATDTASSRDVLLHALDYFISKNEKQPDVIILLQPTSPFRNGLHIREALGIYNDNLDMVVSVKETKTNPYYVLYEEDENGLLNKSKESDAIRRQDVPKVWEINGAIYIINPESIRVKSINEFNNVMKYEMDEISSHDIDTFLDWNVAEEIVKTDAHYKYGK
ncbi:acylneuraminate cytidylyltransferase family protein [Winogradskyella sp.]|uniref:acylneuraminate cytidylyltransferase family protein n=1 Tax=Winogradskyella sp. TaxID=1883156 RepID=UPI00260241E3|nr:acylneuraminate cytidylyltransferase family protein [Winogradskyella sp.]